MLPVSLGYVSSQNSSLPVWESKSVSEIINGKQPFAAEQFGGKQLLVYVSSDDLLCLCYDYKTLQQEVSAWWTSCELRSVFCNIKTLKLAKRRNNILCSLCKVKYAKYFFLYTRFLCKNLICSSVQCMTDVCQPLFALITKAHSCVTKMSNCLLLFCSTFLLHF